MIKLKDILNEEIPFDKSQQVKAGLEEAQEKLDSIANTIPYLIEDVLGANTGDIFVM